MRKQVLGLLVLGAIGLILAAFVLEYGFDAKPCQMCWWQRYGHWAMAVGGIVFLAVNQVRLGLIWIAFLAVAGMFLGAWQVMVQYKILPAPQGCSSTDVDLAQRAADLINSLQGVPPVPACDKIDFTIFGITLAGWNVFVMLGFLGVSVWVLTRKEK